MELLPFCVRRVESIIACVGGIHLSGVPYTEMWSTVYTVASDLSHLASSLGLATNG